MTLKTRNPAVARIADRTQCQWPSRSSKVNDFHVIWQGVCHFLLAINSKLGCISAQFPRYGQFSIGKHTKTHTFLPPFIQRPICKHSPWRRWLKFCTPELNSHSSQFMYKFFPYALPVSHSTSVTDGQMTTMTIAWLLLKYGRLIKITAHSR